MKPQLDLVGQKLLEAIENLLSQGQSGAATASRIAYALFMYLKVKPQFSSHMQTMRHVPPTDPEFFQQTHAIEDLVYYLQTGSPRNEPLSE